MADLAYKTRSEIELALKEHGCLGTDIFFVSHSLLSCFVLRWNDITVIAFKGTTTTREWINNFNVWMEPTNYGTNPCRISLYTIRRFGPILHHLIRQDILSGRGIVLTGHSRGGALALLFGFWIGLQGDRSHSVWGFGSPMVGGQQFNSIWNDMNVPLKIYRNVCGNDSDPVTSFPPTIYAKLATTKWLLGFRIIYMFRLFSFVTLKDTFLYRYLYIKKTPNVISFHQLCISSLAFHSKCVHHL